MSTHVVCAVDVFSEVDKERPCCAIRRMGAGRYQVLLPSEPLQRDPETREITNLHDFDTIKEALDWADEIAALVDADPTLTGPYAIHANNLLEAARVESQTKDLRIAELEAALTRAGEDHG